MNNKIKEYIKNNLESELEINQCLELLELLKPCLIIKKSNNLIETSAGNKSFVGLFRKIKEIIQ